ncbi:MAG: hypothetical protein J2P32_06205, partial [Actinobacteria bacterium]|nr:hypothetical protein [Actinomycetota bacterium]
LDKFIELVRKDANGEYGVKGRFIFGSDAVKPESNAQYFRQHHDLEPIWERIQQEINNGLMAPEALPNIRYRTLETRLADARRDVRQWVFNELSDPTSKAQWDEILDDEMSAQRRQHTLDWFDTEQRLGELAVTGPGTGPNYLLPDNTTVADGTPNGTRWMRWGQNRQLQSLIRWHKAVTPDVVSGRRLSLGLIRQALKAARFDRQNERDDRRAARDARREAKRFELDAATDTEGLGLADAQGKPYTVQAIIAAGQTGQALTPQWARKVLELTQESELRQVEDRANRGRTALRLLVYTGIAGAVFAGVAAVGGSMMWSLLTTTAAGYVSFAVRGALGLHRGAYSQQMRVLVESILERGQFNINTVDRLIETMRKYATFDRATPRQIANFDRAANEFRVIAHLLDPKDGLPLQPGESAKARHETALELFSIFLDKAGNALGAQAQSFHGLNPHGGLLGRLLNTALALTFVINGFGHLHGAFTMGGFLFAVNALYAVSDVLFFGQAGPSAVTGWAGWDFGGHSMVRKLVHRLALPVITVANLLLTIQLGFINDSAMVIPALGLTLSSGYLSILGWISEGKLGRLSPRRGAFANAVLQGSLMAFGVFTLLPHHALGLGIGLGGALIGVYLVSRLDLKLSRRERAPPADMQLLAGLSARVADARARLTSAPRFSWDAGQISLGNELLPRLDAVGQRLDRLSRASQAGPVPTHQLDHTTDQVNTVLAQLDTLPIATSGTGGTGGAGGLVAIGPEEPARQAMMPVAGTLYEAGWDLDPGLYPGQPRGPPVAVRLVPAHLRPAGAEGVIAFGWKHPVLAPHGVVLIFDDVFAEILDHIAAGRLTARWWKRLLAHERDYHLLRDEHTGHRHDRNANPIAADLLAARVRLPEADTERGELVGHVLDALVRFVGGPLSERKLDARQRRTLQGRLVARLDELPRPAREWLDRLAEHAAEERISDGLWLSDLDMVRLLPDALADELAANRLATHLDGLVAFSWPDPTAPGGGYVVIRESAWREAVEREGLGVEWLGQLIAHEVAFRVEGKDSTRRPGRLRQADDAKYLLDWRRDARLLDQLRAQIDELALGHQNPTGSTLPARPV